LSAKEYALMEYLVRNPNTVLPRAMIYEHIWGNPFGKFTNIVDVYFNYLRKKIDHPYPIKLIHTERGQGYILREG
jgi:DNA-binding response OmpR family regulator